MSPTPQPIDWHRPFAWCLKAAGIGLAIVLVGLIFQWPDVQQVGGWLMAPMLLIAGGACLLVVLLAPTFPISWLLEQLPESLSWLWIALSCVAMLAWWWLWLGFLWAQVHYGA